MKKKLMIVAALFAVAVFLFAGCENAGASNMQWYDTTYTFNYAYINLFDEIISGTVESWKDYEDSDMVQVKIDGRTYYTHGSNVVLVNNGDS